MGTLFVVATPIGNLNDFSKRAEETLRQSNLILVEDTRQTIKLLNHFDIKVKMLSYHKFNERQRVSEIINLLNEGNDISLVSDAGTPCISDPGYILIKEALENGIKVIGIPGCSAVITSLSVSGLDTSSFAFYGFVPTENKSKKELFERIKHSSVATKVIYESPKRIIKLLEYIKKEIPGCVVSVCTSTLRYLKDNRAVQLSSCLCNTLNDLHVVNIESTDCVSAIISFLKHFGCCYQSHNFYLLSLKCS